ncbi:Acriflavin resistance protein [Caenispirillum salinarum AK4]|uniref:Acriflavin resistance protein n=1 Tax=Caenispirillum salinarum AK4 TaxID=1238182 RepID=K9HJ39_9PROT|nr:efflux RND transporter permease subunit [Caenispirillum salinarum]EKV28611.1 Acriflavin resistance protein [Caenispirillum salinarum AK4]
MRFTDIFVRRPVLATVVSLLILLLGARALMMLDVREYPRTESAVVTVSTAYIGAPANLVEGFITTRLEKAIAGAAGIDYIESTSIQGVSQIRARLELGYDTIDALADINAQINKVRAQLPEGSEDPVIDVTTGSSTASMYMSYFSDDLAPNEITDYLVRVVQPELESVPGVQAAQILGARRVAMRIWLEPDKMASLGVTAQDVQRVLQANNVLAPAGSTKGLMVALNFRASTNITSAEDFRDLVVRETDNVVVRLRDIAEVTLGAESYNSAVYFKGTQAVFMGITVQPDANTLTVIDGVRTAYEGLKEQFPAGLNSYIPYDVTGYINQSITEVIRTIGITLSIVVVVIFLFLGSFRSVVVPTVAIPLSLIGAGLIMFMLGYTLNVLTLLALVLAIGLVVDDAIVMVENIDRHVGEGMSRFDAALQGARELAPPIVATSIVLVAVYVPIGFMGGLVGQLFTEFAYTLAATVFISTIVALTLSPMLASKVLKARRTDGDGGKKGLQARTDAVFSRVSDGYRGVLRGAIAARWLAVPLLALVFVAIWWMFTHSQQELAPTEDQGFIGVQATGAPNASIDQMELWADPLLSALETVEERDATFAIVGGGGGGASLTNSIFGGISLKPWGERDKTAMDIKPEIQRRIAQIAGLDAVAFTPPPLPAAGEGLPIQFVIQANAPPLALLDYARTLQARAMESGLFAFADRSLKIDRPKVRVDVDRDKAAELGLTMADVAATLGVFLSEGYVNRFSTQGRSYRVIPQAERLERLNPEDLHHYYVRASDESMVPLSAVVTLEMEVGPRKLERFQQLDSATVSGVPAPGTTLAEALAFLEEEAEKILPPDYAVDYAGESRQFKQESASLLITFGLAVLIIYLVLAALYESFRDPLIILMAVPTAISGALLFIWLGYATVNIYTQVGLITLIGLVAKNAILIVQFANAIQQDQDMDPRAAVEEAAAIRLRPILMTAFSMVGGVMPLILATGAGAVSRMHIGLTIATGLSIGTLFTLFVVPMVYTLLARDRRARHQGEQAEGRPSRTAGSHA